MSMNRPFVLSLALIASAVLSACSSSAPPATETPAAVAAPTEEPAPSDSLGADPAAEDPNDSCYVVEARSQPGCWQSAEEACEAVGCPPAECRCTEATTRNTCSC